MWNLGQAKTQTDLERLEERASIDELAAGEQIGRYVIRRRLGAGGMGVVYGAHDSKLAREVALKVVRPRGDVRAMQARLEREGQAMARLSHPNVVPVFDIGMQDGQLFLAMELVEGETLRAWVTQLRPWREVVRVFAKAGRGLAAAHASGVLHRDFKPDNVLIDRAGEPRITDFGLARELAVADATGPLPEGWADAAEADRSLVPITATGALAGTPAYMAPEQLRGEPGDARADQFGCCVALFEVLCGMRPFVVESATPESRIAEIRAGRVAKPAATRGVPGWLHQAIARGLAFEPDQRWPSMLALVDALERGLHRRRRRIYGLVAGLAITGAAAGIVVVTRSTAESVVAPHATAAPPPPGCLEVASRGNDGTTVQICKDEYARGNDPRVGATLADAQRRKGELAEATTLAKELLSTSARGDALYTLGKIAAREGRTEIAERSFRLADAQHRDQQRWGAAAADLLAAAQLARDFVDQLVDLDQAVRDARRAGAPTTEAFGHLAAAVVLSQLGARESALAELASADSLLVKPIDRLALSIDRGNVHQNLGDHTLAVAAFEQAVAAAEAVTNTRRALSARLNLAYSLTELGRTAEAASQLKAARSLDPGDDNILMRLPLEAQLAARNGDPRGAAKLVERAIAESDADAPDDLLELEVQRAEIALQLGDLVGAEVWARRAIARIETLRSPHPPVELRSWMIVDRRIPYEILFASLAGRGDATRALAVFDRYHGVDVLAALAHGDASAGAGAGAGGMRASAPGVAFPVTELGRLLSALEGSALATPGSDEALRAARSEALLVLVVARGALWRITAEHGRLQVARIGALSSLRDELDRFRAAPGDPVVAAALGTQLLPAGLVRPTDRILHVVLDSSLAWLPVGALRVGGRRLSEARPIVRAARPSVLRCAPRESEPRSVIRVDAARATRGSLFGMPRATRLHLAAPIDTDALGNGVVVRDGRVRGLEIAGRGEVAGQVVIEAAGGDAAGTSSLAMAFVAAGADQVIATVRPVSTATIARLAERLAGAPNHDLARALARIQSAPDAPEDWLAFAAFGRASCGVQL